MSKLINAEGIARLRQQYAADNAYVVYPVWYNQAWPQNIDPVYQPYNIFVLWAITGDQKWMDTLEKQFHVPAFPLDKNTRRESGHQWISMYELLTPYWSPERLSVLENELKQMMTLAIRKVYSWDGDERISVLVQAAQMDEQFGTAYLTADSRDESSPYYCSLGTMPEHLAMQQEVWTREGIDGTTCESAGYTINTYKSVLYGVACLNDLSKLPGLSEWLPKFRDFMLWSVSYDYKQALNYGDADNSLDQLWEMIPWYRLPVLWLLIGLGLDGDGAIADMAAGIAAIRPGHPIQNASDLHPIYNWGPYLITDMSLIPLAGPRNPLPTGCKIFRNFGAIYRDENLYFYVTATPWLHDDHDYRKGMTDYRAYDCRTGECFINRPGEYGQDWTFYNAAAIKGQTSFDDRGLDSAEFVNGVLTLNAHHRGPMVAMSGAPVEFDYVGHEWLTRIEFIPANVGTKQPCLKVRYDWKHDGVFPDPSWSAYYPNLREFRPFESQQFMEGGLFELDEAGKVVKWNTPKGREMLIAFSGSEQVGITPWVYRGYEWMQRFRMYSDSHIGFHEIVTTAGVLGEVPPPPAEPPIDPDLIQRTQPVPEDQLPAPVDLIVVDNTSLGYHIVGGWIRYPGVGVGDEVDYVEAGDGSRLSVWRARINPGIYNIATIWTPMANRATNAPFKIKLGDTVLQTVIVNQELPPSSFDSDSWKWHTLADVTVNTEGVLTVELSNAADEFVIADAVRFEKIGSVDPPPPPDIDPPPPEPTSDIILPLSFENGKYVVDRNAQNELQLFVQETFNKD